MLTSLLIGLDIPEKYKGTLRVDCVSRSERQKISITQESMAGLETHIKSPYSTIKFVRRGNFRNCLSTTHNIFLLCFMLAAVQMFAQA